MSYDRKNAVTYARTYWWQVCHDQYVATTMDAPGTKPGKPFLKVAPGAYFDGQNQLRGKVVDLGGFRRTSTGEGKVLPPILGGVILGAGYLEDCTHFISCCLGPMGGGLNILSDFPQEGPYGRLSPRSDAPGGWGLFDSLTRSGRAVILGAEMTHSRAIPTALEEGDLIAYWNGRTYQHFAMYLGKDEDGIGMITCHSWCRWWADWRLSPRQLTAWTFLHVK
jgi:hypothetical protein